MKALAPYLRLALLLLATHEALAITRYVDLNSTSPTPPYTSWATAATVIQDAIDAGADGDLILVTNGLYETGGRIGGNGVTNRASLIKAVTVQSVNGPAVTVIKGYQVPGVTNDYSAVRCAYLTNGATLNGFTLTNGATWSADEAIPEKQGGGAYCESTNAVVTNCIITGCSSTDFGGGVASGTINNCTLVNNTSYTGGGAAWGVLNNCRLTGNHATTGGGAYSVTLNNCLITRNTAISRAGGVWNSVLNNCTVVSNSAASQFAGGAWRSTIRNCIVYHNTAPDEPNISGSAEYTCTTPLVAGDGNFTNAPILGDEFHLSSLSPCRGAGNAAYAGGVDLDGQPWSNPPSVGCDEYIESTNSLSLTVDIQTAFTTFPTNVPMGFTANINGPVGASRWEFGDGTILSNTAFATHAWAAAGNYLVVLRAYNESYPTGLTATVTVQVVNVFVYYVSANNTNPFPPFLSWATAATNIQDAVDEVYFPANSLVLVSNGVYETGARVVHGSMSNRVAVTKPVTLQSVNGPDVTIIRGNQAPGGMPGDTAVRCVYLTNGARLIGFTLTNGASRLISSDVKYEKSGGGVFGESTDSVVSNCVISGNTSYNFGGGAQGVTLSNCVLIANSSFLGGAVADSTLVNCSLIGNSGGQGGGAYNCTLNNCLLTGNTAYYGGAVEYCTLSNCAASGNSASVNGGATVGGFLANCLLVTNSAPDGGGAIGATLYNCTLSGNSATNTGGGAHSCLLRNCIVYYNSAPTGPNCVSPDANYCCTAPDFNGAGNFTNAPLFVNALAGDFRLQTNSPCINAGNNAFASSESDVAGNPRIVGGTVDVGAYEFQTPASVLSYIWAQQNGLPTDGTADFADPDADGANNWHEWRADTIPTNALSVLRMVNATNSPSGLKVTWQSVVTRNYFLQRAANIGIASPFQSIATNIAGSSNTTTYTDTNAINGGRYFYRVGVQ